MGALWAAYKDFVHQVSVAVALFLILVTGLVVDVRLASGHDFPSNYDTWIWALIALAGVNVAGIAAIRATGVPYQEAKNAGKNGGPPQVNVAGDANVQTAATAEHPVPTSQFPIVPKVVVPPKPAMDFRSESNDRG